MGFLSICYEYVLLPLVNKEDFWPVILLIRVKPGGKSEQRYREKVGGVRETPCSCRRRKMLELYQVSHNIVAIHRIETG